MDKESNERPAADGPTLERAIVLQLLRDDHQPRWSQAALAGELEAEPATLQAALTALNGEGVLSLVEEEVFASPATRRLDELELIGI
jgi:hypothetical protein